MKDVTEFLDTSKDLGDLPLEQPFDQKGGMSIDSAGLTEDLVTLLTFLAILIISIFSGYFGPSAYVPEQAIESLQGSSPNFSKFSYSIINLSSITRYLSITLILERIPTITPTHGMFSLLLEGANNVSVARLHSQTISPFPTKFNENEKFSQPVRIFTDQSVNYSAVNIQLSFSYFDGEYNGVKILFSIGNPEFVVYEMFFRVLFFISLFCFLFFTFNQVEFSIIKKMVP